MSEFEIILNCFERKFNKINNRYSETSEIAKSRKTFFQGSTDYLLVTERFHFFRRYNVRGAKNLVFYSPPTYAPFFEDFVCHVGEHDGNCTLLYVHPFDQMAMQRIVGAKKFQKMQKSPKNSHFLLGSK